MMSNKLTIRLSAFALSFLLSTCALAESQHGFRLLDSTEQGVLNIGQSQAEMNRLADRGSETEVVALDYTIPQGSAAGIWTKGYPSELARGAVDTGSTTTTRQPLIGHGEILPGTPQPYYEFEDDDRTLNILTPYTPRPYDHSMSNALGHVLCVTNRGLHSSASVNAQQNRITTEWADTVTSDLPPEVFYLYDADKGVWFSPTYLPLKDRQARYDIRFSVDGSATFHMERDDIATELTTYVPPDDPTGVYLLTVTNKGQGDKRLRFAPYFQIALADNPENAGTLKITGWYCLSNIDWPPELIVSILSAHVRVEREISNVV